MTELTKEDKDHLLDEKMAMIRRQNEEIMRRHAEVQADKRNADILSRNSLRIKSCQEPPVEKPRGRGRILRQSCDYVPKAREIGEKMRHRLEVEHGPPPDPNYNFLADRCRINSENRDEEHDRQEHNYSRRHHNNFGGCSFENVKTTMQQQRNYEKMNPQDPPRNKLEMSLRMTGKERTQYQQWKEERHVIDQERIARHMTPQGTYRREWDLEKSEETETRKKHESQLYRQFEDGKLHTRGNTNRINHNFNKERDYKENDVNEVRLVTVGQNNDLRVNVKNEGFESHLKNSFDRLSFKHKSGITSENPSLDSHAEAYSKHDEKNQQVKNYRERNTKSERHNHGENSGSYRKTQVFTSRSRGRSDTSGSGNSYEDIAYDGSKSHTFVSSSNYLEDNGKWKNSEQEIDDGQWGDLKHQARNEQRSNFESVFGNVQWVQLKQKVDNGQEANLVQCKENDLSCRNRKNNCDLENGEKFEKGCYGLPLQKNTTTSGLSPQEEKKIIADKNLFEEQANDDDDSWEDVTDNEGEDVDEGFLETDGTETDENFKHASVAIPQNEEKK